MILRAVRSRLRVTRTRRAGRRTRRRRGAGSGSQRLLRTDRGVVGGSALVRRGDYPPVVGEPARWAVHTDDATRPGQLVQIDSTVLDVMVVLDSGVLGRPDLTMVIDVATRTIAAAVLRPSGIKAVDAALLLARMLVPEPMRPGWSTALRMSASRLPHARLVGVDARLELAAAKPVIVPETIVIDHGRVFVSEVFTRACANLGISIQPARKGTPTDKPIVERQFSSINTLFCQHVAGYTGANVTRRGDRVADEAVWSLAELRDLLDEWIVAGWQRRPHEGLLDPHVPGRAISPNDAYAALVATAGYLPMTLSG